MVDREVLRQRYARLFYPRAELWRAMRRAPPHVLGRLFDDYLELAKTCTWSPRVRRAVLDFAWLVGNDMRIYARQARRYPKRRLPAYARAIAEARRAGQVPLAEGGIHVSVLLRHVHRSAAPGAFVVVPSGSDYRAHDFTALAGLEVEILVAACDVAQVDELALELDAQGAASVSFRRIDGPFPRVELYRAGASWLYNRWLQNRLSP